MLEILGLIWLSKKNAENAKSAGKNPVIFVLLTIVLWVGMEFLGAYIGNTNGMGAGAYALALVFALIGGGISYAIAKA